MGRQSSPTDINMEQNISQNNYIACDGGGAYVEKYQGRRRVNTQER